MLYTADFDMLPYLPDNITPISISHYYPKDFKGTFIKNLMPSVDLVLEYKDHSITRDYFTRKYTEEVLKHHVTESWIKKGLEQIVPKTADNEPVWESMSDHVVFCTYGEVGDFCYRNVLAEHLVDMGISCTEATKEIVTLLSTLYKDMHCNKEA